MLSIRHAARGTSSVLVGVPYPDFTTSSKSSGFSLGTNLLPSCIGLLSWYPASITDGTLPFSSSIPSSSDTASDRVSYVLGDKPVNEGTRLTQSQNWKAFLEAFSPEKASKVQERPVYHANIKGTLVSGRNDLNVRLFQKTGVTSNTSTWGFVRMIDNYSRSEPTAILSEIGKVGMWSKGNSSLTPNLGYAAPYKGNFSSVGTMVSRPEILRMKGYRKVTYETPFGSAASGNRAFHSYGVQSDLPSESDAEFILSEGYFKLSETDCNVYWAPTYSGGEQVCYVVEGKLRPVLTPFGGYFSAIWDIKITMMSATVVGVGKSCVLGPYRVLQSTRTAVTVYGQRLSPPVKGMSEADRLNMVSEVTYQWRLCNLYHAYGDRYDYWPLIDKLLTGHFETLHIENFQNLAGLGEGVKAQLPNLQDVRELLSGNALRKAKALASLFLWYKFTYLPNVSDGKDVLRTLPEICENFKKQTLTKRAVLYATDHDDTKFYRDGQVFTTYNVKVCVDPDDSPVTNIILLARSLGLAPGMLPLWDLLPFSFVINWFTRAGKSMDQLDQCLYRQLYGLVYYLQSCKHTVRVETSDISTLSQVYRLTGTLDAIYYSRSLKFKWPEIVFELGVSNPRSYWAVGLALIVAKLTKRAS